MSVQHRRALALPLLLPAALLAGCGTAHTPEEDIASGVYELSIAPVADDCSPERLTGELGAVSVVSDDGLLSVPVPETEEPTFEVTRRVTLLEHEGFHVETSDAVDECPSASLRQAWTVVDRSESTFVIEHVQRFEQLSGCGPMESAPSTDCEAVRELRFDLRSRCEAPCELTWTPGGGVSCSCG